MLEPCKGCFYTIMANYHGSLKAVDCHVHSVRYVITVNRVVLPPSQMPHQVTYDVVTTLIRPKNA
eukprot:scaffold6643_cov114-Skeletonema_dohrnii-CCMP3373.AAC.10